MRTKTVWVTKDNREFLSEQAAVQHEARLVDQEVAVFIGCAYSRVGHDPTKFLETLRSKLFIRVRDEAEEALEARILNSPN